MSKVRAWVKGTRAQAEAEAARRGLIAEVVREASLDGMPITILIVHPDQYDEVVTWFLEDRNVMPEGGFKPGTLLLYGR